MSADDKYNDPPRPLRVVLLFTSERRLTDLVKVLETNGLVIAGRYKISTPALATVSNINADVVLVDLDESAEQILDVLEQLLESATLPILFNDNATTDFVINTVNPEWGNRLAGKLWALAKRHPTMPARKSKAPAKPIGDARPKAPPAAKRSPAPPQRGMRSTDRVPPRSDAANDPVKELWVLGASLGGPLAVREFLSKIPDELPVAFVLAQHIGASHLDLLAEQLDRITPLKVSVASAGLPLKPNTVILAPVDQRIFVDGQGRFMLVPKGESIYSPCIDHVMEDMAQRFRERCGAIIFSGMGNDGERGCHIVAENGGVIWAQEADTCVISSMPDNARKTGFVSFNGTPEELARELAKRYRSKGR